MFLNRNLQGLIFLFTKYLGTLITYNIIYIYLNTILLYKAVRNYLNIELLTFIRLLFQNNK